MLWDVHLSSRSQISISCRHFCGYEYFLFFPFDLLITVLCVAGRCLFVDAEHALDLQFAEGIGVRIKEVLFQQPDEAEQALDTVDHFVRSGVVDVIVVDSVCPGTSGPPEQFTFYRLYLLFKYCLQLSFLILVHPYVEDDIFLIYIKSGVA